MKILFQSLASGSSGNCYYIGTHKEGILVDAGIPVRQIKKNLKELKLGLENILGVIITHDHADHIKSVATLGDKYHLPIYCTAQTFIGINQNKCIKEKLSNAATRFIQKEDPFSIGDLQITAFEVLHDANDNVGYLIETPAHCTDPFMETPPAVNFCFLTDVGRITERVSRYITRANHLILEANYDDEMLAMGSYPEFLKSRIRSERGHLSNTSSAEFLTHHIANRPLDTPAGRLQHVWLCHLSQENNHPELALKTFDQHLRSLGLVIGLDLQLSILRRTSPTESYEVGLE